MKFQEKNVKIIFVLVFFAILTVTCSAGWTYTPALALPSETVSSSASCNSFLPLWVANDQDPASGINNQIFTTENATYNYASAPGEVKCLMDWECHIIGTGGVDADGIIVAGGGGGNATSNGKGNAIVSTSCGGGNTTGADVSNGGANADSTIPSPKITATATAEPVAISGKLTISGGFTPIGNTWSYDKAYVINAQHDGTTVISTTQVILSASVLVKSKCITSSTGGIIPLFTASNSTANVTSTCVITKLDISNFGVATPAP